MRRGVDPSQPFRNDPALCRGRCICNVWCYLVNLRISGRIATFRAPGFRFSIEIRADISALIHAPAAARLASGQSAERCLTAALLIRAIDRDTAHAGTLISTNVIFCGWERQWFFMTGAGSVQNNRCASSSNIPALSTQVVENISISDNWSNLQVGTGLWRISQILTPPTSPPWTILSWERRNRSDRHVAWRMQERRRPLGPKLLRKNKIDSSFQNERGFRFQNRQR